MKNLFLTLLVLTSITMLAQVPCSSGFQGNGVDDFITIPNTDAINLQNTRNRTVEFWFKTSDITTRQVLYEEGAQVNALYFYLEGGRVYLGAYRDDASTAANRRLFRSGNGTIEVEQWNHVALTLEDTSSPDLTLRWFLNGIEQDSQDGLQVNTHSGNNSFARNGGELRYPSSLVSGWVASSIGSSTSETYNGTFTSSDGVANNYAGNIALFRIWNVARTQPEIDTNKSVFLDSGTDLVAYLDEDRINYQPDGGTSITSSALINGNQQFTVIPNTDAINLQNTRDRTVEFLFTPVDITTRQVLYEEGGGTNAITAFIEDGRFYFGAYRDNAGVAADRRFFRSASGDIIPNTTYHVAITLEDTSSPDLTLKWFLNGVEQDSQDGLQINTHSGDINVGRGDGAIRFPSDLVTGWGASSIGSSTSETYNNGTSTDGNTNDFTGTIELFRIWNVARTPSEVDGNQTTFLDSGTSLVAYQEGTQINYQPNGGGAITDVVDETGVFTWDGSSSNVFILASNWVGDNPPDATRRQIVTITDGVNDPLVTTEISVGNLIVNSGAEVVIQDGATLNVYYSFENNGIITVEDGGSLIYHNCNSAITGSGTFNVSRDSPSYTDENFFSYWSSPVVEIDAAPAPVFLSNTLIYFFDSSTTAADWVFNGTSNFKPGIGYAVRSESSGSYTATFTGKINEGGIDVLTYFNTNQESSNVDNVWSTEGDNLIGNPYASALDWDLVITDTDNAHLDGTIFLWNQTSAEIGDNNVSDYEMYNLTGGATNTATGNIGTGQSFFVRANTEGTVKLKPTHQIPGNNNQFFRSAQKGDNSKKQNRSWFSLRNSEEKYSSTLIGFLDEATLVYDRLYDAAYDINNESLGLFSLVEGNQRVSIQGLPELISDEETVPLGFVVDKKGTYTIRLDEEHIHQEYYIYLEDKKLGTITNLRNTSYLFTVNEIGEDLSRFEVIYTKTQLDNTLSDNDELFKESLGLKAYVNLNNQLIVSLSNTTDTITEVSIFNVLGKKIKDFKNSELKDVSNISTGVYIVETKLNSGKRMTKKMVIKTN